MKVTIDLGYVPTCLAMTVCTVRTPRRRSVKVFSVISSDRSPFSPQISIFVCVQKGPRDSCRSTWSSPCKECILCSYAVMRFNLDLWF